MSAHDENIRDGEGWKYEEDECQFQPGDKVICTDDSFNSHSAMCFSSLPVKGRLYVVRKSAPKCVLLVGIIGFRSDGTELGFHPEIFKSLGDARRDAASFRLLLAERREMEDYWKYVRSLDAKGNPRPRRRSRKITDEEPPEVPL